MRQYLRTLGFVLVVIGIVGVFHIKGNTQPVRRADSVHTFFISALEGFDGAALDSSIGHMDGFHRYYDFSPQDSDLSLNSEWRKAWDYPAYYPGDPDIVGGGPSSHFLDVLILEPWVLQNAHRRSRILRFETERHTEGIDTSEYTGFFNVPRHGNSALVGHNVNDASATSPAYLIGSSRSGDASVNAVKLVVGTDAAGIFCDSFWNENFFSGTCPQNLWTKVDFEDSLRVNVRFKVRLDGTFDTSHHTALFEVVVKQDAHLNSSSPTILDTTIYADEHFIHNGTDYDLITLPFFAKMTSDQTPNATSMTLRWLGNVSMTMDYLEVFTGNRKTLLTGRDEYANYDNYEEMTQSNDSIMKLLLDTIINRYTGKIQYVMTQEEFSLAQAPVFKRLAKLLRDRSHGAMELLTLVHDSADAQSNPGYWNFYGHGIPNCNQYIVEGARLGWFDSSLYADPGGLMGGVYPWSWESPTPKRTSLTDPTDISNWELDHVPTGMDTLGNYGVDHYSRSNYELHNERILNFFLRGNRRTRRSCERNAYIGQKYFVAVQTGVGVGLVKPKSIPDRKIIYSAGLRASTGAELKVNTHLALSGGAAGIVLYTLTDGADTLSNSNGGLMKSNGYHDTNVFTFHLKNDIHDVGYADTKELWVGWKERYDTAKVLFPRIRRYGNVLVNSKFIGEWKATELPLLSNTSMLPFYYNSVVAQDDNTIRDAFVQDIAVDNPDTANKTFVHISLWVDTVGGASDTMLYITNMRSDDSYGDTEVPLTFDSRFITLKMKRPHIMVDVADTNGGQLDNGVIWTPFVGVATGDSLKVHLLPGDGVLIRMLDTVQGAMLPMRVAINYPKNGTDFNDHGRIAMDRPLPGVLDKSTASKWTIPSTSKPYRIGIPDTSTASLWQDSLLYHTIHSSRPTEQWRQQHWRDGSGSVAFNFRNQISPISNRASQISTDSIAHNITFQTDLEGISNVGKIKFYDPWFVDSTTLRNFNTTSDTILHPLPFLPHTPPLLAQFDGKDIEHSGGVFLKQNEARQIGKPNYSLGAFNVIKSASPHNAVDTVPDYTDWVFMHWWTGDDVSPSDPDPLPDAPDVFDQGGYVSLAKQFDPIFMKDNANYVARYKAHLATFDDTLGFSFNGQRKLGYLFTDSLGRNNYRMVYSSSGKVFTMTGFKTGTCDCDVQWENEHLVSGWDNHTAGLFGYTYGYPALGLHRPWNDPPAHIVYEAEIAGAHYVNIATVTHNAFADLTEHVNTDVETPTTVGGKTAMPVIASSDNTQGAVDVIAWVIDTGIVVKAVSNLGMWNEHWTNSSFTPPLRFGNSTANHPTIWMDTCRVCSSDSSVHHVWLAWQQDTAIPLSYRPHKIQFGIPPVQLPATDIFVVEFDVKVGPGITFENVGTPTDISYTTQQFSYDNRNPCISGARYWTGGTDTSLIRVAYETWADLGGQYQGITVAHKRTGSGWKTTKVFATSDTITDQFHYPSIEVTRNHYTGLGGSIPVPNYYSIVYDRNNHTGIQHWAMDSSTLRISPAHNYTSYQLPQLSVDHTSTDSNVYRMGLSVGAMPLWLISGFTTLYKYSGNDSLWGYHSIVEQDSSAELSVTHGIGEAAIDDGHEKRELELVARQDFDTIDINHPAEYFTQTENFTLPANGTFSYYRWLAVSNDTLFKTNFDSLVFALDFYDTSGSFICRLDSEMLSDSIVRIDASTRTIAYNRDSSSYGYIRYSRLTPGLSTDKSSWQPIITSKRKSASSSNKRSSRNLDMASEHLALTVNPNPAHGDVNVGFTLPREGEVTLDVINSLGAKVGSLITAKQLGNGRHTYLWHPDGLAAGVYTFVLHFGNSEYTVRVAYIE